MTMMLLLLRAVLLTSLIIIAGGIDRDVLPAHERNVGSDTNDDGLTTLDRSHRELLNPEALIEAQYDGAVVCKVDLYPLRLLTLYSCNFTEPMCTSSICGTPYYEGQISGLRLQLFHKICVQKLTSTRFPAVTPTVCLNLFVGVIPVMNRLVTTPDYSIRRCEATLDGKPCDYCDRCNEGRGVQFDCSNVEPGFKALEVCTDVKVVTRVKDKPNEIEGYIPEVDDD